MHSLLLFLKQNLLVRTNDVNVVVVNNCSTDGTEEMISPLVDDRIRLINRTVFLDNAEKNMFASVEYCTGEYIWFHGDDELPIVDSALALIDMIRKDVADFFVFNSAMINDEGGLLSSRMSPMHSLHLDMQGDALIQTAGFVFMLAGISNVVLKRDHVDVDVAWEAQAIAPIYSHVVWLLICFSKRRCRIVNLPLVFYRNSALPKQVQHFKKLAERLGVGDDYFWGLGVATQLEYLVNKGAIQASSVAKIMEGRRDGTRFRLLNECVHRIYTQVLTSITSGETRQRIDPETLKRARDFLVSCDGFTYDLFEPIEKLNEIAFGKRSRKELSALCEEYEQTLAQHSDDPFRNHWRGQRLGFEIFSMPLGWVAIDPEIEGGVQSALQYIDIRENQPYVWVSENLEDLLERLQAHLKTEPRNIDCSNKRADAQIIKIGHDLVEIGRFATSEYARMVQLSLQYTMPIRMIARIFIYPVHRLTAAGGRILRKWVARLSSD